MDQIMDELERTLKHLRKNASELDRLNGSDHYVRMADEVAAMVGHGQNGGSTAKRPSGMHITEYGNRLLHYRVIFRT